MLSGHNGSVEDTGDWDVSDIHKVRNRPIVCGTHAHKVRRDGDRIGDGGCPKVREHGPCI